MIGPDRPEAPHASDPFSALIREAVFQATRDSVGPLVAEIGNQLRLEVRKVLEQATSRGPRCQELLTVRETARLLKVDPKTVHRWIADGVLPAPIRLGSAVRFRRDDLEKWLETAAPGGEPRSRKRKTLR